MFYYRSCGSGCVHSHLNSACGSRRHRTLTPRYCRLSRCGHCRLRYLARGLSNLASCPRTQYRRLSLGIPYNWSLIVSTFRRSFSF